ncbi:MAG: hypothetical protein ACETWQ_10255 [Phycisphaerae bacterium]
MKRKTMKASWLAVPTLILSLFIGDTFADATIVRGDINIDDGPKIFFSAPVALLQAFKTSGISAMVENKEELCRLIDSLMGELESMKENHLLVLRAKNEVEAHVWVEEANRDEPMRANFVFVDIAPGKHEPEVSLRLPQGIFFLCSFIGNQFVEEHRKEILQMFRQMFLIKIKEKDLRHDHEPPHYGPQPIEEMHQRIGHLKEKIDQLRREGRHEEAAGLEREVEEIKRKIGEMERGQDQGQPHRDPQQIEEMHRRIGNLNEKIDYLRREGRHEEAAGLEREVEKIKREIEEMEREHGQEQPRHDPQPIEEMHRRIGNLREKIDQLRREGRHNEAEGLERQVDDIRRKIEEMERGHDRKQPHQESSHNSEQRTRILNEAVDNMLKAAQRLHEADMHELAEKLAREAEKFRGEIHK